MERKRIAFITNSFARGGAERVLSRIIPILKESYEICLLLIDGSRIEYECPVEIIKMGGAERRNRILYLFDQIAAKKKLEKIIKEKNIECVISFLEIPNLINLLTNADCRKIISIRRAKLENNLNDEIKEYLCKKLLYKADAIISVSSMLNHDIIKKWPVKNKKVVTIENPYDIEELNLLAEENINEEDADFYADHRVIVAMGRLEKQKGHIYLLDSFYNLLSYQKDAGLVIVGTGGEKENLEKRVKQLGIEKNVIFCGMKKNPFPYLKKAQIFVLSSIAEGFPNALVEAMGCGLPVIACDCISGPREILYKDPDFDMIAKEIEWADYGVLVPDFTERNHMHIDEKKQLMANAMNILLEDDNLRDKYAKKAFERAQYYTFERCIEKYKEVIG